MFEDNLKVFANRINDLRDKILTEEATKTSLVMPFFQSLGYDIFNPSEFIPEFTADIGIKRGEKVDYAIILNDKPAMLIEVKVLSDPLEKHTSQLYRYYSVAKAKFAILTNGEVYKFFTDLDEPNKMDTTPFLEIDLSRLRDAQLNELKKFHKDNFNEDSISDTASELKYMGLIKSVLKEEFSDPTDDFIRNLIGSRVYAGQKNQTVIDKFRPMVKKSINLHINEIVNERIQNALQKEEDTENTEENMQENTSISLIETTKEEMTSYYIVKSILRDTIDAKRIFFKDTQSYFGILLDNKVTRWICRVYIKDSIKYVIIVIDDEQIRFEIKSMDDLYNFANELITRTKQLDT